MQCHDYNHYTLIQFTQPQDLCSFSKAFSKPVVPLKIPNGTLELRESKYWLNYAYNPIPVSSSCIGKLEGKLKLWQNAETMAFHYLHLGPSFAT